MGRQTPNTKVRVPSTAALLDFSHSHRVGHIGREVEPVTGSLRNPQHVAASQRTGPPYCAVPEREEEQGGQRSQQLGKTSQSRAAARAQDMPTGGRLAGIHICACSLVTRTLGTLRRQTRAVTRSSGRTEGGINNAVWARWGHLG